MMTRVTRHSDRPMKRATVVSRDHDIQKGAIEDGSPSSTPNAPGLNADGLPDDETTIAASALGARVDRSQG